MIITKYADLSDSKELLQIVPGKLIKEYFPDANWEKLAIFCNGEKVDENHIVKESDLIIIRSIPGSITTAAIIIGVIALISGVVAGVSAYKANKAAKKAQKELEKLTASTKDDITNLPYLKGATNTLSTGKTQPYIIGQRLWTPYILNSNGGSKGFSTIAGSNGENQYYNVVLEGGFNRQSLQKIYCDDITLRNFDGSEIEEGKYTFESNSVFSGKSSFIEVAQDGNAFETEYFNQKIVEQSVEDELKKHPASEDDDGTDEDDYEDLFYTLEKNSSGADVCIMFNGLYHMTDAGVKGNKTRTINPSYSLDYAQLVADGDSDPDANATWHEFKFSQAVWHDAVTTTKSAVYSYEFTGIIIDINKQTLINNIADWELTSGDDIRSDFDSLSYEYSQKRISGSANFEYKFTIKVKKTTVISEGYYDGETLTNEFTGLFKKQIRYNAHVDFNYEDVKDLAYPITIKVSTPDREVSSGSDQDATYVEWVHSYCYDVDASSSAGAFVKEKIIDSKSAALSTLIGLHIESTTANEDKLSSIQLVTSGIAKTWNGSGWSETKTPTSNPASWLIEVLTSDAHTPSQVDESELDLEAFGELYEECEDKGYKVNYVITSGATKSSILELICNVCHAVLYQNIYGQISVTFDGIRENACAILNEQNLISFNYETDLTRQPDGVKITYCDSANEYNENTIIVMYDGTVNPENRSPDSVITELSCDGITNYEQAYLYALYKMRCVKMRPKTISASIGKEGYYFTPLSKVLIQHPSLKIGVGNAEIKSVIVEDNYITGLELYEPLTLNETDSWNIIVQCVGSDYCTPLSIAIDGADGRTNEITLTTPISINDAVIPHAGDILSYGKGTDVITRPCIITAITPNDNGFALTLVDYDERIFAEPEDGIPEYNPSIVSPVTSAKKTVTYSETLTADQVEAIAIEHSSQMRILESLLDAGTNGEVAIYNGAFFRYDGSSSSWKRLDTSGYLGTRTSVPVLAQIDSFFLCTLDGIITEKFELYDGTELILSDDSSFEVSVDMHQGFIYYADENGWHRDNDRNSWRYITAIADLTTYGYDLPDAIPQLIEKGSPEYIGAVSTAPTSYKNGDWFVASADFDVFEKGQVYKCIDGVWTKLDQSNTDNSKELMTCLSDLLKTNDAGTGYFSTIFSNALISNEAFIKNLFAEKIKLTTTYAEGTSTFTSFSNLVSAMEEDDDAEEYAFKRSSFMNYKSVDGAIFSGSCVYDEDTIVFTETSAMETEWQNGSVQKRGYSYLIFKNVYVNGEFTELKTYGDSSYGDVGYPTGDLNYLTNVDIQITFNKPSYGVIYGGDIENETFGFSINAKGLLKSSKGIFNKASLDNATIKNAEISGSNFYGNILSSLGILSVNGVGQNRVETKGDVGLLIASEYTYYGTSPVISNLLKGTAIYFYWMEMDVTSSTLHLTKLSGSDYISVNTTDKSTYNVSPITYSQIDVTDLPFKW